MKRLLFAIALVALALALGAGPALASDQTITGTHTFASLDGSAQDDDGLKNGVFTVTGNLTIAGSITCNDDPPADPNADACPIRIDVGGSMTMQAGSAIVAENRVSGGLGGAIDIDVGDTLTMQGGSTISSSDITIGGGTGAAGPITITVGDLTRRPAHGHVRDGGGRRDPGQRGRLRRRRHPDHGRTHGQRRRNCRVGCRLGLDRQRAHSTAAASTSPPAAG